VATSIFKSTPGFGLDTGVSKIFDENYYKQQKTKQERIESEIEGFRVFLK